jgi:hypothetical protein
MQIAMFVFIPELLMPTLQITGDKKQSDVGAVLFGVRVNLPCCVPGTARILKGAKSLPFVRRLFKS